MIKMRLIDADELLNNIEDVIDIENDGQDVEKSKLIILGLKIAKKYIKKARTIEAEPVKHGRWEINCDGYYPYCSNCKNEPQGREMTLYCPNCGARMDGGSE